VQINNPGAADIAGRREAEGELRRLFNRGTRITLTAERQFADQCFQAWRTPGTSGVQRADEFVVTVGSDDLEIEAVYVQCDKLDV